MIPPTAPDPRSAARWGSKSSKISLDSVFLVMKRCIPVHKNIVPDDVPSKQSMTLSSVKARRVAATQDYVQKHSRMDLRELRGKVRIAKDYDHKVSRAGSARLCQRKNGS